MNKLKILKESKGNNGHVLVTVECDCRNTFECRKVHITSGSTKRCHDCRTKYKIGQRFNLCTLISKEYRRRVNGSNSCIFYKLKCECGTEIETESQSVLKSKWLACWNCREKISFIRQRISNYKKGAQQRKHNWELTEEQSFALLKDNCHYCGIAPSIEKKINGIDRLHNDKGYIATNVVTCCWLCNRAKNDMPLEVFTDWLARLVKHSLSRPTL